MVHTAQIQPAQRRPVPPLERNNFWHSPFAARTWREFGFLTLMVFLTPFAFAYVIFAISFSAGTLFTLVLWLGVLGWLVVAARGPGAMFRGLARSALRTEIPIPTRFIREKGFWPTIRSVLGDATGWRAMAYMFLSFFLSVIAFCTSVTVLAYSLGAATHWIWARFLPAVEGTDGQLHRGTQLWPDYFIDTPVRLIVFAISGVILFFVWAALNRGLAQLHRLLAVGLLSPTAASERVARLAHSRSRAVEGADATLRRIERDLHDGTQARLVAVAMQLGEAKEHAVAAGAPPELTELIASAHDSTKDTLTELRELARGIHPPVLDSGLATALETLAARSPLPLTLDVSLPDDLARRPDEAIETIAYFCVTELVTNVIKHARANHAYVLVEELDGTLRIRVRDDGIGGAAVLLPDTQGQHSGLLGLQERVESVDGNLTIASPLGGPSVVTAVLPLRVP